MSHSYPAKDTDMQQTPARLIAIATLIAAMLAACGDKPADSETATAESAPPADYAALVNGQVITREELAQFVEARQASQQDGGEANPGVVLQELVNMALLEQAALKQGLEQRADIKAEIDRQRAQLLARALIRDRIDNLEITDADLQTEYDAQVAHITQKEYKARHILVKEEDEAKAVITEIDGGADFAEVAKEKSTGPSGPNGGDLGWFRSDTMVPEFAAAVQQMQPGEHSKEPVQTQFGWHVILLEEVRPIQLPAFEDVKEQLRQIVTNKAIQDYIEELRNAAEIDIKPAG
jgi:peptidyl-prolyl cis-trans isomerase C